MSEKSTSVLKSPEPGSATDPAPVFEGISDAAKNNLYSIDNSGKSCDGTESGAQDEDSEDSEPQPQFRELAPLPSGVTRNHMSNGNFRAKFPASNVGQPTHAYYYYDGFVTGLVKCSACTRAYKPSTRIDTLMKHVTKKHGVVLSRRPALGRDKVFILPATNPPTLPPSRTGYSGAELEEAVVRWILEDSIPLSSIESPALSNLLGLIAPKTDLPTLPRLREVFQTMLTKAESIRGPVSALLPASAPVTITSGPVGDHLNKVPELPSQPTGSRSSFRISKYPKTPKGRKATKAPRAPKAPKVPKLPKSLALKPNSTTAPVTTIAPQPTTVPPPATSPKRPSPPVPEPPRKRVSLKSP